MIQFYMTEYEKDGNVFDGPLIMAPSLEVANQQAKDLKLKLVGEMFPLENLVERLEETLH
jgi:hypothetical protein|tara:strand:+ start:7250 stop:7429 length:180 start_codon:yes stop_codon:yes gene_type:complete